MDLSHEGGLEAVAERRREFAPEEDGPACSSCGATCSGNTTLDDQPICDELTACDRRHAKLQKHPNHRCHRCDQGEREPLMPYTIANYSALENPNGVDCYGDLMLDDKKVGSVTYVGSRGEGPWVRFTDPAEREAFEALAGIGLVQERAIHNLFDDAEIALATKHVRTNRETLFTKAPANIEGLDVPEAGQPIALTAGNAYWITSGKLSGCAIEVTGEPDWSGGGEILLSQIDEDEAADCRTILATLKGLPTYPPQP